MRLLALPESVDVGRERVVKSLHQHFLGDRHFVDLPAGLFGLCTVLVKEGAPLRIPHEQSWIVGRVRLDIDLIRP